MKKILCGILALLTTFVCFSACQSDDESSSVIESSVSESSESAEEPVIPTGYVLYQDARISFAFPAHWSKTIGSVTLLQDTLTRNNITVTYEAASNLYATMTTATFKLTLKPTYEAMGMEISEEEVSQKRRDGLKITIISYHTVYLETSMYQTQYIITGEKECNIITVTEVEKDPLLISTVYNTLSLVEAE